MHTSYANNSTVQYDFSIHPKKQLSFETTAPKQKVLVLAGPTAVGKTSLSLELAKDLNGEIVSIDAMQVYKNMDVGTAKIRVTEREDIEHHMIDVRNIDQTFNVVEFTLQAHVACKDILSRGKTPILVGGSGFYIHSFIYGPPLGPPSIPEVRKRIEMTIETQGTEYGFSQLKKHDPEYAKSITPHDRIKIIRALEIIELTKEPVSKLHWHNKNPSTEYDFRCWFLSIDRNKLYSRIEERCEEMIQEGLIDEVKYLMTQGILNNPSAYQAIGYRQVIEYLMSNQTDSDYEHMLQEFKKCSRRYAKRQYTWFRKEPIFRWIDLDKTSKLEASQKIIQDWL